MRLLRDTPVRIKVLIPPAVLMLALGTVSVLAVYGLSTQRAALNEVDEIALERLRLIDEFSLLSEQVQSDVFHVSVLRFMNLPEEEIQAVHDRLQQGLSDLNVIYGQILTQWTLDETERSILERLKGPMDDFRQQALQATAVISDNPSFGILLVRSSTVPFAEYRSILTEFRMYQQTKITHAEKESNQRAQVLSTAIIVVVFLITLVGITTAWVISTRLISQPILVMTNLMRRLADGDLSIKTRDLERRDEIGAMAQAVKVFRDNAIEKARLDEELQESEARYRALVEASPNAILVHSGDKVLFANSEAIRVFGATDAEELTGKPVLDLVHPDHQDIAMSRVRSIYEKEELAERLQEKFLRLDGTTIDVEVTGAPVDYMGKPASQVVFRDITERRQAEDALRESESRFRDLAENIREAFWVFDWHEQRVLYVSPAYQEIWGRPVQALLEDYGEWGESIHPDDVQYATDSFQRIADTGGGGEREYRIVRPDGSVRWVSDRGFAVYGENGAVHRIVGIAEDITERKQTDEALHQYTTDLEARNAELDAFAHTVAHDLQNPLGTMIGFAEVLKDSDDLSAEEVQRFLHNIERSGRKMSAIIDELLLLSSVRKREVKLRRLDMENIVDDARLRLLNVMEKRQAKLLFPEAWPASLGYGPWVEEVWFNYLSNAIKYGGSPPQLELGAETLADGMVRFWVRDNGPGLSPEEQARLFVPFTQLAQVRAKGHGLGLSIVRRIVEKLGGEVGVESEGVPGCGSLFFFTLQGVAGRP